MSTETIGLLGTGAQDIHLEFHTAPELCQDKAKGQTVYSALVFMPIVYYF